MTAQRRLQCVQTFQQLCLLSYITITCRGTVMLFLFSEVEELGIFRTSMTVHLQCFHHAFQSEKTLIFSVSPLPPQISIVITGNCMKISVFFLWTMVRTVWTRLLASWESTSNHYVLTKLQPAWILFSLLFSAFWLNFKLFMTTINYQIPPQIPGNVSQVWEIALTRSEENILLGFLKRSLRQPGSVEVSHDVPLSRQRNKQPKKPLPRDSQPFFLRSLLSFIILLHSHISTGSWKLPDAWMGGKKWGISHLVGKVMGNQILKPRF